MSRFPPIDWSKAAVRHGVSQADGAAPPPVEQELHGAGQAGCTTCQPRSTAGAPARPASRDLDPAAPIDWSQAAVRSHQQMWGVPPVMAAPPKGPAPPKALPAWGVGAFDWGIIDPPWGDFRLPDLDAPACYLSAFADVARYGGESEVSPTVVFPGIYKTLEFRPSSTADARSLVTLDPTAGEPAATRLLLALSDDGVSWYKTGLVVANHGGVPAVAVEHGVLYVFFNASLEGATLASGAAAVADVHDPLCIAYTSDLRTWTYRIIGNHDSVNGIAYDNTGAGNGDILALHANDPSVVRGTLKDGREGWLLFYTLHWGTNAATFVAESPRLDALPWTQWTRRVFPEAMDGGSAEDPSVIRVETSTGHYYQYAAGWISPIAGGTGPYNWIATLDSTLTNDGTVLGTDSSTCGGFEVRLGNPMAQDALEHVGVVPAPGSAIPSTGTPVRWYGHVAAPGIGLTPFIVAPWLSSEEGTSGALVGESGACLPILVMDRDYESGGVKGPAVTFFNGCWVMVYVSEIPPNIKVEFPASGWDDASPDF